MRRAASVSAIAVVALAFAGPVAAQESPVCRRTVIFTLPSVTWADVVQYPHEALLEAARDGAIGSMSARTIAARTTPQSGFASIGAGARVEAGHVTGGPGPESGIEGRVTNVEVEGLDEIRELLDGADYSSVEPGALAGALGDIPLVAVGNGDIGIPPPAPEGYARWTLLAATDPGGNVDGAAVGSDLLMSDPGSPFGLRTSPSAIESAVDEALALECASLVIDHGDLSRVDRLEAREGAHLPGLRAGALAAAGDLLAHVREQLDEQKDLLLVVSPTSPAWEDDVRFGVAMAIGPGFEPGTSLESATTSRPGMVSLPDVAPTVLEHLGIERPSSMLGRSWFATDPVADDRVADAVALDEESVFIDGIRTPVSTAFVLVQIALYALTVAFLSRSERKPGGGRKAGPLEAAALAIAAFPIATYLLAVVDGHDLGEPAYVGVLLAVDAALVGLSYALARAPLDRLLVVAGLTLGTLAVDLVIGAPLQLNTVFSYSPIVAGRFSGIGNIAFAVLAAAAVLTGMLVVQRWGRGRRSLIAVGLIFAVTIVVDGAPSFGSDVGGALALTPGLGLTLLLLAGRKVTPKVVAAAIAATILAVGAFLAFDLTRPEESRTHLARLYEDVRDGGSEVFTDALSRKINTNLRVARSTIWTFVVPVALAAIAWLLLRPQGRWRSLSQSHPALRAGLMGGLLVAVLGFAVNDSGIVIPAMMFSYLVPVALLAHLSTREAQDEGARP